MDYRLLLLVAARLSCCAGESSVHGPPQKVLALAGGDVILPCSFNNTATNDLPTVEWSKEGLEPGVVFLYRDSFEIYEEKNPAFEYRTNLIMKEVKNGNISLRISNVRPSDAGTYQCKRLWGKTQNITTMELVVGAEPKLSVVSTENGAVTVQCEVDCWLLEPQIKFLDHRGNNIPADDPKGQQDSSGSCAVTRRATLQDATHRVTCRVHQQEINHTRDTQIHVPADCRRSCGPITGLAVGGTVLLLALCGLTVLLWKRCGRCEEQKLPVSRQSSDQSTLIRASESQPFLKAANERNATVEKLMREVAALNSKLLEKEKTICQLQNDLKSQLSPVVCHLGQPTFYSPSKCSPDVPKPFSPPSDPGPEARNLPNNPNPKPTAPTNSNPPKSGSLPQNQGPKPGISQQNSDPEPGRRFSRHHHIKSSPAVLDLAAAASGSSSASTSRKKLGLIGRSMSESHALTGPNRPKLQRRHSSAISASALSNNRFTVLAKLTEESEQLVQ